ncbi:hypothetical protein SMICM17S_12717 [Streptomyces microflavus]
MSDRVILLARYGCSAAPHWSPAAAGASGAAIARHLASVGWHTVICGRDTESLDAAVKAAADDGLVLHAVRADAPARSVAALFERLAEDAHRSGSASTTPGTTSRRLAGVKEQPDGPPLPPRIRWRTSAGW